MGVIFFNTKNEEKTMAGLLDEKLRKVVIYVFLMVLGRLRIKKDLQEQGK